MNTVSIATLLVVIAMASATRPDAKHYDTENAQELFEQFIKEHNREYKDDADKQVHYEAFVSNLKEINKLNEGNPSATYGINKFADYTDEEKKMMRGGVRKH
ncbi:papain [Manduca sexta]|uniref:papain n=1 Tax=Manduca sexta TaxID=7130 RepID=UPI0011846908|nr:papain [Manduca sexta]